MQIRFWIECGGSRGTESYGSSACFAFRLSPFVPFKIFSARSSTPRMWFCDDDACDSQVPHPPAQNARRMGHPCRDSVSNTKISAQGDPMKFCAALLLLLASCAFAQEPSVPKIEFQSVPDFLKLPP